MYAPWRVALRKESVDRNTALHIAGQLHDKVALRKESVDRNTQAHATANQQVGRSPQGERG